MRTSFGFTHVFLGVMLLFSLVAFADEIPAGLLEEKVIHYVGACFVTREGKIARDDMEAYQQMMCVAGQKPGEKHVTIIVRNQFNEAIRVIYLFKESQKVMWDVTWRGT